MKRYEAAIGFETGWNWGYEHGKEVQEQNRMEREDLAHQQTRLIETCRELQMGAKC